MVAIKELGEKLKKTLVKIKQKFPVFVYKKYEDETIRKKLLDNRHKTVNTLEKYIKITGNVENPKSFKNAVKDYNLNKKKEEDEIAEDKNTIVVVSLIYICVITLNIISQ
jgi:transcriptional regulator of met regulon